MRSVLQGMLDFRGFDSIAEVGWVGRLSSLKFTCHTSSPPCGALLRTLKNVRKTGQIQQASTVEPGWRIPRIRRPPWYLHNKSIDREGCDYG